MARNVPLGTLRRATPQLACGGRFSGVHWWPDLGVYRGSNYITEKQYDNTRSMVESLPELRVELLELLEKYGDA